jgi:POT family proton-dependent oligopeptide transporter
MTKEGTLDVYSTIGWVTVAIGIAVIAVSPVIRRLMHLDTLENDDELAGYKEIGEREAAGMFPQRETKPETKPL